jgi:hypothetical protein
MVDLAVIDRGLVRVAESQIHDRAAGSREVPAPLPPVTTPTLLAYAGDDMLLRYMDGVAALTPGAGRTVTGDLRTCSNAEDTVAAFNRFFDAPC